MVHQLLAQQLLSQRRLTNDSSFKIRFLYIKNNKKGRIKLVSGDETGTNSAKDQLMMEFFQVVGFYNKIPFPTVPCTK